SPLPPPPPTLPLPPYPTLLPSSLKTSSGTAVAATVSYNSSTRVLTLTPSSALAYSTAYTVSLSGARDAAGNTMAAVSWSFTTARSAAHTTQPPPPSTSPSPPPP